ncbi:hypothetical protein DPEC_G00344310 [Dallia pectoralis]|uniref:Uncharacterized protein n=1 Tax=Dallia pectoralis TaxID=75939 RepID=A0ACC2F327_DALPE|nr:hypothetical protein DPEC_G00344310 [Dallia pectoralis]
MQVRLQSNRIQLPHTDAILPTCPDPPGRNPSPGQAQRDALSECPPAPLDCEDLQFLQKCQLQMSMIISDTNKDNGTHQTSKSIWSIRISRGVAGVVNVVHWIFTPV